MPTNPKTRPLLVQRIRAALFSIYGPHCAECGCDLRNTLWEVNHIFGRDWTPRKKTSYNRHLRYFKEAQRGLINLLCRDCNNTYRPRREEKPAEDSQCPRFQQWLRESEPF